MHLNDDYFHILIEIKFKYLRIVKVVYFVVNDKS